MFRAGLVWFGVWLLEEKKNDSDLPAATRGRRLKRDPCCSGCLDVAFRADQFASMFVFTPPLVISLFFWLFFFVLSVCVTIADGTPKCPRSSEQVAADSRGPDCVVISDHLFPIGRSGNRKSCLGLPSPLLNGKNVSVRTDAAMLCWRLMRSLTD